MITQNPLTKALQVAGQTYDQFVGTPGAHCEFLSEVYEVAVTRFKGQLDILPQEEVIRLLTQVFRRASGRERYHRTRCITVHEDSILTTGDPSRSLGGQAPPSLLDELIRQEDCRRLIANLEHLPAHEQALLLTLDTGRATRLTLGALARQEGVNVRTLQRRRKQLLSRLRQSDPELEP